MSTLSPESIAYLKKRQVLITGGTGSFGRQFARTVLEESEVTRLVIYSRDELKQFEMQQELAPLDGRGALQFVLGDVRDLGRLEMSLREIDTVVHAAALKQIPAAEQNPFECVHTNILGAENIVRAAMRAGVERVVALSTDKACNPVSLYGASKLAADRIFIAANGFTRGGGPQFSVTRYGNVLDSRGSVVPYFRRLLSEGAAYLPITDERMTRFWITLTHGVSFVSSCVATMHGGETFVAKAPSMKVIDLASAIAPGMDQRFVGIRPGEKLHEVMVTELDARCTLDLGDRYVIEPVPGFLKERTYAGVAPIRVPADFQYASDTNPDWLTRAQLAGLLSGKGGPRPGA